MVKQIQIGNFTVGSDRPAFVIAEAGVNHNGSVAAAQDLIRAARRAGADCVKFQTFQSDRVVTRTAPKAQYQLHTTDPQESQLAMLRSLELPLDAYAGLIELCHQEEIVFLSTPYNIEDVDFLADVGVAAFKLASIHLVEPYFLQYVAEQGKPMIISTGMATLGEVDEAMRAIRATGNDQIVVLQCTTNYPSRLEDTHLRAMTTLAIALDTLVGYSDHTPTDTACMTAIALGACVIEKHFTLDRTLPGPDQSSSANPAEFQQLVQRIREVETVLGSPWKRPCAVEIQNAVGMRRSIVAQRAIAPGDVITAEMLTFKRPATGLKPIHLAELVGQVAQRSIAADEPLTWDAVKPPSL